MYAARIDQNFRPTETLSTFFFVTTQSLILHPLHIHPPQPPPAPSVEVSPPSVTPRPPPLHSLCLNSPAPPASLPSPPFSSSFPSAATTSNSSTASISDLLSRPLTEIRPPNPDTKVAVRPSLVPSLQSPALVPYQRDSTHEGPSAHASPFPTFFFPKLGALPPPPRRHPPKASTVSPPATATSRPHRNLLSSCQNHTLLHPISHLPRRPRRDQKRLPFPPPSWHPSPTSPSSPITETWPLLAQVFRTL